MKTDWQFEFAQLLLLANDEEEMAASKLKIDNNTTESWLQIIFRFTLE